MLLLAITGATLLEVLIWLVIAGMIYYLVSWGIAKIGIPEPFNKLITVILVIAVIIVCVNALLLLIGKPLFTF